MPVTKTSGPVGRKQAPVPGPKSAAKKKIVAAGKNAEAKSSDSAQGGKKHKSAPTFSTLKSRQRVVDRVRREIWGSAEAINRSIVKLALCGNLSAAKALFDFAGVYELPWPEEDAAVVHPAVTPINVETPAPPNPVDAFFQSIGIEPPCDEPEPDVAA